MVYAYSECGITVLYSRVVKYIIILLTLRVKPEWRWTLFAVITIVSRNNKTFIDNRLLADDENNLYENICTMKKNLLSTAKLSKLFLLGRTNVLSTRKKNRQTTIVGGCENPLRPTQRVPKCTRDRILSSRLAIAVNLHNDIIMYFTRAILID